MEITTKQVLKFLYILSWIIFVGICIQAGGFIFNTFYVLAINPAGAQNFWNGLDMSGLFNYDKGYFLVVGIFMSIVAVLKAVMFYIIIKMLHDKRISVSKPFSVEVVRFIRGISFLSLMIGLFAYSGVNYVDWLKTKGAKIPDVRHLDLTGADVWLFMAVILFVIAQVFKRGIELQAENDLTV